MQRLKTILYLTDNTIEESIGARCVELLKREANGIPIVSVSHKPMELGKNVCVGDIGRSWMSLYKQILAGIEAIETPYLSIAEHDCIYSQEHLAWIPPRDDTFYYNSNHWLVQWGGNHPELNGMYSYWPSRVALSQLVCHKDMLKKSTEDVIRLLDMGLKVDRGLRWYGEPGVTSDRLKEYVHRAFLHAESGKPVQLQRYLHDYVNRYRKESFQTTLPNVDIRHGTNFTGPKRGKKRCYEIPYWGKFTEVMNG